MTKFFVHCLALALGALCALAQSGEVSAATNRQGQMSTPSPLAANPAVAVSADGVVRGRLSDDTHKLGAGDKLSFQIVEDREPIKSLVVTDSQELDVPYVGRVSVAGKTCKQLGEELKALLEKDYYYKATLMIGLDQASRLIGRVYVWGQVRNQGAIEIPMGENFTVGKAILRAGGFGDFANKKKVKLVRTGADGQKQTVELNMVAILEDGKTELDVTLQPDDFIIVPARAVTW